MINENENKNDLNVIQTNLPTTPVEPQSILPSAPDLSLLEKLKDKELIFVSVLIVLAILVVGSVGLYYFKSQKTVSQNIPNSYTGSTLLTSPPESTPTVAKEQASVQYIKKEKILGTVKYQSNTDVEVTSGEDWELEVYNFYKVGTITSGKYKDGDLLLVLFKAGGPCKGASCDKPVHLRYIKKGNVVTLLPKISYPFPIGNGTSKINPFKKFGFSLAVDSNFTIPILEYPKEIQGVNQRQILKAPEFLMEEDGEFDPSKIYKVFTHPIYGDIYTTKTEFSPSRSFEPEGQGGAFGSGSGTGGCEGTGCFTTNQFFAFRPDGTFLKFSYGPDFLLKDITWTDNKKTGDEYVSYTVAGCSLQVLDDNSVVAPSIVSDTDLEIIGKVTTTGDTIYGLKDTNHAFYKEFYDTYKKYFIDWDSMHSQYTGQKHVLASYEEFLAKLPAFFWRDLFGRLIRFTNTDFLPVQECEPIIYLYPSTSQQVTVNVIPKGAITDSAPTYYDGWTVVANPNGTLVNTRDNRSYPYLFWEGWSSIFPMPKEGFVVKKSDVYTFLKDTLPLFGLNEKETGDFLEAWLPQLSTSPYYFITFIDSNFIDLLAPLTIKPKPDTVIRVLMDFKPLDEPIQVPPLQLKEPPQRTGFTVVEWGGLRR